MSSSSTPLSKMIKLCRTHAEKMNVGTSRMLVMSRSFSLRNFSFNKPMARSTSTLVLVWALLQAVSDGHCRGMEPAGSRRKGRLSPQSHGIPEADYLRLQRDPSCGRLGCHSP
eukprot:GHVL01006140.1.p1 GENE.GHVL01006140.1~~GHVL01006140.1.p1  ORF type:complete len:113 (+),score=4.31 GHVL01006140.1:553-891(+)